jgi:Type II secretion system (T2SS), protein M subtype b
MMLLRRILREKRAVVVPLAVAAALNVAVFALVVYPWSLRLRLTEQRASAARAQLAAAERDDATVRGTLTGKERADIELGKFYEDVLPGDLAGARRMSYARLAQLARDNNLQYDRRSYDPDDSYEGRLRKLRITMALEGDYADVRRFIHDLETSPEFVVIEEIALTEGDDPSAPLTLTLKLATYFQAPRDGA